MTRVPGTKTPTQSRYHDELPWVELPRPHCLPTLSRVMDLEQSRKIENALLECEQISSSLVSSHVRRQLCQEPVITDSMARMAWRRFFLCHSVFFYNFALLAESYRRTIELLDKTDLPGFHAEVDRACSLWESAGSIMRYGVDFASTEDVYKSHIRPFMPEAFSGTWIPEARLIEQRKLELEAALKASNAPAEELREVERKFRRAEQVYYRLHGEVMKACVPELLSSLQKYKQEHGAFNLEDRHSDMIDQWFHVRRSTAIGLAEYVDTGCREISRMLIDIRSETDLEERVLERIANGVRVMSGMLREIVAEQTPCQDP